MQVEFENNEVEEYYLQLQKEFGYFHANYGKEVIAMEDLLELKEYLRKVKNYARKHKTKAW